MIAITSVQDKVRDLIAAHATFTGESVVSDAGKSAATQEAALKAKGHAVTVLPLLDGQPIDEGGTTVLMEVGVAVRVEINPQTATKGILTLLKDAVAAVRAYTENNPQGRFRLDDSGFVLETDDPGLLSYLVFFKKRCVL